MRVMLDTNILVSAIIFPNDRMDSLICKASIDNQLVLSSYIIDELFDIIERKFPEQSKDVDLFLTRLPYEFVYSPKEYNQELFTIRDINDYLVLYSAITEDVDIFVTGDKDFADIKIEKPEVISPSKFIELY